MHSSTRTDRSTTRARSSPRDTLFLSPDNRLIGLESRRGGSRTARAIVRNEYIKNLTSCDPRINNACRSKQSNFIAAQPFPLPLLFSRPPAPCLKCVLSQRLDDLNTAFTIIFTLELAVNVIAHWRVPLSRPSSSIFSSWDSLRDSQYYRWQRATTVHVSPHRSLELSPLRSLEPRADETNRTGESIRTRR